MAPLWGIAHGILILGLHSRGFPPEVAWLATPRAYPKHGQESLPAFSPGNVARLPGAHLRALA